MSAQDIFEGNELAPGEALVWRGGPSTLGVARDVFHMRGVAAYFVFLFGLDAFQAWAKAIPVAQAVHDSVPLAVITGIALAILGALSWLVGRTTHYVVTDRRVILHYGIALTATLSIPFRRIVRASVAANRDGTADIAVELEAGNRMPYLKLWPHARPWRVGAPQPMLRLVPQGAVVGGLLIRALQAAEQARVAPPVPHVVAPVPAERMPELLSA